MVCFFQPRSRYPHIALLRDHNRLRIYYHSHKRAIRQSRIISIPQFHIRNNRNIKNQTFLPFDSPSFFRRTKPSLNKAILFRLLVCALENFTSTFSYQLLNPSRFLRNGFGGALPFLLLFCLTTNFIVHSNQILCMRWHTICRCVALLRRTYKSEYLSAHFAIKRNRSHQQGIPYSRNKISLILHRSFAASRRSLVIIDVVWAKAVIRCVPPFFRVLFN